VIDAPPPEAVAVVASLRAAGAFVQLDVTRLVVVAQRSMLTAVEALAGPAAPLVTELLRAFDTTIDRPPMLRLRDRTIDLTQGAAVMGILNVTPDSFFDGGRFSDVDKARSRASEMVGQGAALIDIGGQSYAAGNEHVAEEEERERVVPVVRALVRDGIPAALSIDTFKATVAEAALDAGAHLVNDCSGLSDPRIERVVATYDAGLVVMHLKGELNVRSAEYPYDDALAEIVAFLRAGMERAAAAGVAREALIVDPGLEFGKEPRTDLEILDRFADLGSLGAPILLASSRKGFLGRIFARPASELLIPSLATAALGILRGAVIVRAHDVGETKALARLLAATRPNVRDTIVPA
jgi:dihydropteroate synthase